MKFSHYLIKSANAHGRSGTKSRGAGRQSAAILHRMTGAFPTRGAAGARRDEAYCRAGKENGSQEFGAGWRLADEVGRAGDQPHRVANRLIAGPRRRGICDHRGHDCGERPVARPDRRATCSVEFSR
jgi:hypothetical protein